VEGVWGELSYPYPTMGPQRGPRRSPDRKRSWSLWRSEKQWLNCHIVTQTACNRRHFSFLTTAI